MSKMAKRKLIYAKCINGHSPVHISVNKDMRCPTCLIKNIRGYNTLKRISKQEYNEMIADGFAYLKWRWRNSRISKNNNKYSLVTGSYSDRKPLGTIPYRWIEEPETDEKFEVYYKGRWIELKSTIGSESDFFILKKSK